MATLEAEMQDAIAKQDFERCARLRDQIDRLKESSVTLDQSKMDARVASLNDEMAAAVASQRFEKCAAIRDKIKAIEDLGNEFPKASKVRQSAIVAELNKLI